MLRKFFCLFCLFLSSLVAGDCGFDDNLLLNDRTTSKDKSGGGAGGYEETLATRWKNNEVLYYFDKTTKQGDIKVIKKAMEVYHENTCIKFKEIYDIAPPLRYLDISIKYLPRNAGECEDQNFGKVSWNPNNRKMIMYFNNDLECEDSTSLVVHELGHTVGLAHTQVRYDRNKHVKYNEKCVEEHRKSDFEIRPKGVLNFHKVPYKCNSFMHYPPRWGSNGCDTLEAKSAQCKKDTRYNNTLGGNWPIKEDWDLINRAHCNADEDDDTTEDDDDSDEDDDDEAEDSNEDDDSDEDDRDEDSDEDEVSDENEDSDEGEGSDEDYDSDEDDQIIQNIVNFKIRMMRRLFGRFI